MAHEFGQTPIIIHISMDCFGDAALLVKRSKEEITASEYIARLAARLVETSIKEMVAALQEPAPVGIPSEYKCGKCGASTCKLWREHSSADWKDLYCARCAGTRADKDVSTLDDKGTIALAHGRTNQIGWLIPAIPKDNVAFWAYGATPPDRWQWWHALPNTDQSPK